MNKYIIDIGNTGMSVYTECENWEQAEFIVALLNEYKCYLEGEMYSESELSGRLQ